MFKKQEDNAKEIGQQLENLNNPAKTFSNRAYLAYIFDALLAFESKLDWTYLKHNTPTSNRGPLYRYATFNHNTYMQHNNIVCTIKYDISTI